MKHNKLSSSFRLKTFIEKLPVSRLWGSIKAKLMIGLLIPILVFLIYGIISYKKSEDAIISNYEASASDTISAINKYMDIGLNLAEKSTMEITFDINFMDFFKLKYQDAINSVKSHADVQDRIHINAKSNDFISDIHIVGSNGVVISTRSNTNDKIYEAFMDTTTGQYFKETKAQYKWLGEHAELDKILLGGDDVLNTSGYAASIVRRFTDGRGFIIIDISADKIRNILSEYDMGKGSILGYITEDGRETLTDPKKTELFTNLSYYQEAMTSDARSGYSYEKYNGNDYLFIFNKFDNVPGIICALIPKATILNEVRDIKTLNILFITLVCIIALAITFIITKGITDTIRSFNKLIAQTAKGDLTVKFDTKRRDEFKELAKGISDMMQHMSNLIGQVQAVTGTVSNSVKHLSTTSGELLTATKGITETIDDMGSGMVHQAEDAQNCAMQMSGLSEHINQLYENTNENEKIADYTQEVTNNGIQIIEELNEKSKATSEVTQDVIRKIQEFEVQSKKIEGFVNIINEIASQTNLLSLNASIEAARAGEAGRGFAVVAEEIRKLADQSMEAANQIQNTVKDITEQNKEAVSTAGKAEEIVSSQTEALTRTINVFKKINLHVNSLADNFKDIIERLKTIETVKEGALTSIQNISAVTQQTAASSEEMNATAILQMEAVEQLSKSANILENDAKKLVEAIKIFKIKNQ